MLYIDMKMKSKITIKLGLIASVFAILIASCTREEIEVNNVAKVVSEPLEVTMRLTTPSGFPSATRSGLTELQENAINDIYVFAFKAGILSYVKTPDEIYDTENSKSFKVTLKSSTDASDTYKLMVVANAQEQILALAGNDLYALNGKGYNEIQQLLKQVGITEPMYPSGGNISMWGELPYEEIKSTNKTFHVSLVRSVSRVDVGLGAVDYNPVTGLATWGGLQNFTLQEVYLYKPNNGIHFVPAIGNYNSTDKIATKPTPAGAQQPTPFIYTVGNGKSLVREIYTPEADVRLGSNAKSGDANHKNRMAVVVKGSYNGNAPTYYRLDFINKERKLIDVLRNHLYQFNIKKVSGNGFTTPDEAYESLSVNMDVEVVEWNDGAIGEIAVDGQYILGVSKGEFSLPMNQRTLLDEDNKLSITTNYPDGWSIEKIVGEDDDLSGASWLTVNRNVGPANETTTISLLTDQNISGQERVAFIHIKAGRLTYVVKVIQTINQEIGLRFTNGSGKEISELLYFSHINGTVPAQTLNVSWMPKSENPMVGISTVGTFLPFSFGSGDAIQNGAIEGQYGSTSYSIQPPAMLQSEIDVNPFFERMLRVEYTVSNGASYMSKSLYLIQRHLNAVPTLEAEYEMNGQDSYFTLKSNAPWRIEVLSDPDNVVSELITTNGGHSRDKSPERVYFTLADNTTNPLLSQSTIKFVVKSTSSEYPFSDVVVTINAIAHQAAYTMNCESFTVQGLYRNGVATDLSNYATVSIATAPNAIGAQYIIETNTVDGLKFKGQGIITSTNQTVRLDAMGTPTSTSEKTFTVTSNSITSSATCTFNVAVVIPKKTLLAIGTTSAYGYNFSTSGSASNKLITTAANYGILPNSTVKAEGFTIINGGYAPTELQMRDWLVDNPVDIIVLGYDNSNISTTVASYYSQFLNNGGVVLAYQDRIDATVSGNFLKSVLNNSGITISYATGAGSVYQFTNTDTEVLNGPFGNIRGKQWGEDASTTVRVSGIDPSTIEALSGDRDISVSGSSETAGYVTAFKHKTLNLIWIGDGGFNSNNGGTDLTICPFKLDGNNAPIAKPSYGRGTTKHSVHNSTFTANALAWALKQAEKKNN